VFLTSVDCEKDVDFRRDVRERNISGKNLYFGSRVNNKGIKQHKK
jgi:hypothetical protein